MQIQDPTERRFKFTNSDDPVTAELENFVHMLGIDRIAPGRYSFLLVISLFAAFKSGFQSPDKVMEEIKALETGRSTGLKPPIQNKWPPLKGLWHKHYLQDGLPSIAKNVELALKKYGMPFFDKKIREAQEAGEERFMTADDLMALSQDVVHGNLGRRHDASAMTGEWLVFARHEGKNFYLSIATHDKTSHDHLRQNIDTLCCMEFPFLADLLATAEAGVGLAGSA
jgi:hypothetical protein